MKFLILAALVACVNYPKLPAQSRSVEEQSKTLVRVESECQDSRSEESPWNSTSSASGVILDARHVLTAGHVVRCPMSPGVHVSVAGRRLRMLVVRDELMFGDGRDFAVLEIASAENFSENIAPPVVDEIYSGRVRVVTRRGGTIASVAGNWLFGVKIVPGDSGAPVYSIDGNLVGVVTHEYEGGKDLPDARIERYDGRL